MSTSISFLRSPSLRLALLMTSVVGCSRQDTEILARVGRKLSERVQGSTAQICEKIPFKLIRVGGGSLEVQVQSRLRSDKTLHTAKINVSARGGEVELKGELASEAHKRRALDLVESTVGVEKVIDSLRVAGAEQPAAEGVVVGSPEGER